MIDRAENKSIPGPRMVRQYLSPSAPNAERMVCECCNHAAPLNGGEIVHAADCKWAIRHKARRIGQVETKDAAPE
jgi:hypothetical protein